VPLDRPIMSSSWFALVSKWKIGLSIGGVVLFVVLGTLVCCSHVARMRGTRIQTTWIRLTKMPTTMGRHSLRSNLVKNAVPFPLFPTLPRSGSGTPPPLGAQRLGRWTPFVEGWLQFYLRFSSQAFSLIFYPMHAITWVPGASNSLGETSSV
jgi:hypothetical protein